MAENNPKRSLLAAIWHRIKFAFVNESEQGHPSTRLICQMKFLERCLLEDCLIEKNRKQLERQWQEVSH